MNQKKIFKLASEIYNLEKKCQNGENVSENMKKMTELCKSLSLEELLQLDEALEALN